MLVDTPICDFDWEAPPVHGLFGKVAIRAKIGS